MKRYPEDMLGRTVIVTGAGNGLGLGIARRFVAGGARVLFVDQDPVVLTPVEEGKQKTMFAMVKDLAEPGARLTSSSTRKRILAQSTRSLTMRPGAFTTSR